MRMPEPLFIASARQRFGGSIPATPWVPSDSGAKAWLDVTVPATLYQDTGFATPFTADGQTIKGIKDNSANNKDFTGQNDIGWIYRANSGHPYLEMQTGEFFSNFGFGTTWDDGTGQFTIGVSIYINDIVGNQITVSGANVFGNLLGNNAGVTEGQALNASGANLGVDNGPSVSAGAYWRRITQIRTGFVETWTNGVSDGPTALAAGTLASGGEQLHIQGKTLNRFCAMAAFPSVLSSTDIAKLDAWLQSKQ